ncbi:MAG: hypothetical protein LUG95_04760, partial [Clostridiales bacterium]|nr:hypothetical protein [Clostridiales bacterium]
STYDTARRAQGSDYAKCQGLWVVEYDVEYESYEGNCCWLLRSAGYMSGVCTIVNHDGTIDPCENTICNTEYGIRPALCFDFSFTSHTVSAAVTENEVAATCTQVGSCDSVVYCSDCGAELSRETITVPATGLNYTSTVIAPTCTAGGSQTYTCSVCGYSYTEELSTTGHTAGEAVIENDVAATCTQDGS